MSLTHTTCLPHRSVCLDECRPLSKREHATLSGQDRCLGQVSRRGPADWALAFLYCGYLLRSQQNPERESVRDQQQWYEHSRNEIGGAQLSRVQPGIIRLVESIQKIG